jgi:hypothetical protein
MEEEKKQVIVPQERMAICRRCKHFEKKWARCKLCGCFMNFKTAIRAAKCPAGKW